MKKSIIAIAVLFCFIFVNMTQAAFVHPGCLSTQTDLDRMMEKVEAEEEPWKGSWDILVSNTSGFLDDDPLAVEIICVEGDDCSNNFWRQMQDCHKAYQCALRYNISGETDYGSKAIEIMNAWASTHTGSNANSNGQLRTGLYGYVFACAGELMRDYSEWEQDDFETFQKYMIDLYYNTNKGFLEWHNGTCDTHYWANWELASMVSAMAIGVLSDGLDDPNYPEAQEIFDYALDYYYNGAGNGNINNLISYVHPNGLAQWQESGRDQGHASMGVPLLGTFCEIAWNQGVDLYGEMDNIFLSTCEYIAKHNLFYDVPYTTYVQCDYWVNPEMGSGQGFIRAGYDLVYNHYVNRVGMSAPYSQEAAEEMRPEGGGFNYGGNTGGFDQIGFTTLTHSLDPIDDENQIPGFLQPHVKGSMVTLSWRGTPYADSYNVKRSAVSGGPYTTLAAVGNKNTYYIDTGLISDSTYYYVVSANNPDGESSNSEEASVTTDSQLYGTVIGTKGSWEDAGLTIDTVFDGSLKNYFDAPIDLAWAGLDLGENVSAVITQVKYCPRPEWASHMVGGKFQGSNTADFSSGVTDLFTIESEPTYDEFTVQTISNPTAFRYVRYLGSPDDGHGNVSEVQFLGNVSGLNAPAFPIGVEANVVNGYSIDLIWNTVPETTNYTIKRATNSGGPYVILEYVTDTDFTDTDLPGNTTFYYVVNALNSAGESIDSVEKHAATHPTGEALIAHCKFDGDSNDSSGYGYHPTATGEPAYTVRPSGQAIILDGTDDLLTLPSGVADFEDITIAIWVYWNGGDDWQRIFDFGNNTTEYMFLTPCSGDDTLRFAITTNSNAGEKCVETSKLTSGQWTHIAVTLQGNTAKLYVDGTLKNTNTSVTVNPNSFNPSVNYIGDSQWSGDSLFSGQIDDFRIYNYALSASQVSTLATPASADTTPPQIPSNLEATTKDGYVTLDWSDNTESDFLSYTVYRSILSGSSYDVLASDLTVSEYTDVTMSNGVTYYYVVTATDTTLNESANSTEVSVMPYWTFTPMLVVQYNFDNDTADSSVNGNDAAATGSPEYTTGVIDQAITLDGTDDLLTLPEGIANSEDITIAAWVYWNGGDDWQRIFDFGNGTDEYLFMTPSSSDETTRFAIKYGRGEQTVETSQLAADEWTHVAITLQEDIAKLYINGILQATNDSFTFNTADFNPAQNYIGLSQWGDQDPFFDGQIDDFRIYNYALSGTQIAEIEAGNFGPSFTSGPINNTDGIELRDYIGTSLANLVVNPDGDVLTFTKDSGPDWLVVSNYGLLSGIPEDSDVGSNVFTVQVNDSGTNLDTETMTIEVVNVFSGINGMDDLAGLFSQWLNEDCGLCDGADLDGNNDVTVSDFAVFAENWLAD